MHPTQPAEILRIHISESDRHNGKPLYEVIVAMCREWKIAGATVFSGVEGYGETAAMHRPHLVRGDRPIVVMIVDTPENIGRLTPVLAEMIDTGLLATSAAQMIRIEKRAAADT